MSFFLAAIAAAIGFFFLPGFLMFLIFSPMGWGVTAISVFFLLLFTIYKIYMM